jgi:serine/threonine-protein kinase
MVRIETDATGRLTALHAVPSPKTDFSGEKKETDWDRLFVEAGLDRTKFEPAQPELVPPVFGDEHVTWAGPHPANDEIKMRIEAAAYDSKPVYFRILTPWDEGQWSLPRDGPPRALQVFVFSLIALVFIGIAVLSVHNFRAGRGDLRGSLRVMAVFLGAGLLSRMTLAHHVADLEGEMRILGNLLGDSIFLAVLAGVLYSALEPQIRRVWPELLISWSRLLAGDFRDPMVGRDVLFGGLLGMIFVCIPFAAAKIASVYGEPLTILRLHTHPYEDVFRGAAGLLQAAGWSMVVAFGILLLIFIFIVLFRRRWAGIVGFGSLLVFYFLVLGAADQSG